MSASEVWSLMCTNEGCCARPVAAFVFYGVTGDEVALETLIEAVCDEHVEALLVAAKAGHFGKPKVWGDAHALGDCRCGRTHDGSRSIVIQFHVGSKAEQRIEEHAS